MTHVEMTHVEMTHVDMTHVDMTHVGMTHVGMTHVGMTHVGMTHVEMIALWTHRDRRQWSGISVMYWTRFLLIFLKAMASPLCCIMEIRSCISDCVHSGCDYG